MAQGVRCRLAAIVFAGLIATPALAAVPVPVPKPSPPVPPADVLGRDFEDLVEPRFWAWTSEPDAVIERRVAEEPSRRTLTVGKDETLLGLMLRSGVESAAAYQAIDSLRDVFDPRSLRRGQEIAIVFGPAGWGSEERPLVQVALKPRIEEEIAVRRAADGFAAERIVHPLEKRIDYAAGYVVTSLYDAAREADLPLRVLYDMANAYGYDVDFQRDLREGDMFEVLYERYVLKDGRPAKDGDILAARLHLSGETISVYRYEGEFYKSDGRTVRKALMRTPINGARLTSKFGMRHHPILGYSRMHRGVDFAAPRGTPIMAAGNGVVVYAGRRGGYGNYVKIRHNDTYETAYAHLNRFAGGIRTGQRVRQGQVIAFVGTTGQSTGPHLHFEVLKKGSQINPLALKSLQSDRLDGKRLAAFRALVQRRDRAMDGFTGSGLIAELPADRR